MRGSAILFLLVLLGTAGGCVPLRPLAEVRESADRIATGQLLNVGGQGVYGEFAGQGEPIILLHGFGASSYSWRKVMPDLAQDYRVIALDLNGFGLTDRPLDDSSYTREGQVALVLHSMDALGIESAHFIGHSYGGALTMALTAQYPERVRSMVLVDSAAPEYPIKRRKRLLSARPVSWTWLRGVALRKSFVRRAFRHAYYDDSNVTDELVEAYRDRLRVEGMVQAYRNLTRPRREPPAIEVVYSELGVPALVVWGAQDKLVSEAKGRAHAKLLPDYRFVTIDGSGHSPMEEKPLEFLAAVRPFLEEVRSRNLTAASRPSE